MRFCKNCPIPGALPGRPCPAEALNHPAYCEQVDPAHPRFQAGRASALLRKALGMSETPPLVLAPGGPPRRPPSYFPHDVAIRAALTGWTGYGQIAEWLGRGLVGLDLEVAYEDSGTDTLYGPPSEFVANRIVPRSRLPWVVRLDMPYAPPVEGRRSVAFSMWETDALTRDAVDALNRAEAVCVPCRHNRDAFLASGVVRPIHLVPLGVSADEGYADDGTPPPADICRFGMAGRMAHGGVRKGLNEGMAAFVAAFPRSVEDVRLEVKVWEDCLPALRVPDDPRIAIVTTPMSPAEMATWYRRLTCYVVPSKGEGWGLHTLQAMAVGRPVIAAPWSGTADFWTEDCGWPLRYRLEPAGDFYDGLGRWAVPWPTDMVAAMRAARQDRPGCIARGRAAAARAAEFGWDRTARAFRRALEAATALVSHERLRQAEGCPYRREIGEGCCAKTRCAPGGRRAGQAVTIRDCLACLAESPPGG